MGYNLDYTSTPVLLAAYEQKKKPTRFLQTRYFPRGVNFGTDEVLVEYKKGARKMAPFVTPEVGGKFMARNGYRAEAYKPAFIAPKRALSIDTLKKKGFGEAYYRQLSPAERAMAITANDLQEMDEAIVLREEWMCAQLLKNNSIIMKHYNDDNVLVETKKIEFFEGGSNTAIYTPTVSWDKDNADILGDGNAMVKMLTDEGLPAVDMIVGSKAKKAIYNNEKILKLLDNRRVELGFIDPTAEFEDATLVAQLDFEGHKLNIIEYTGTYEDETTGNNVPYIAPEAVIVTAPDCGVTNYGAITQIDYGQFDFTTYSGPRVPLYKVNDQVREVALRSAPLVQPKNQNPYIYCKAIFS